MEFVWETAAIISSDKVNPDYTKLAFAGSEKYQQAAWLKAEMPFPQMLKIN